jgi:hypothetical protein
LWKKYVLLNLFIFTFYPLSFSYCVCARRRRIQMIVKGTPTHKAIAAKTTPSTINQKAAVKAIERK